MNETVARGRSALENVHAVLEELTPRLDSHRSEVTLKEDDTPVTSADRLVQRSLEETLRVHFPELTFVGEEDETTWTSRTQGWVAVVDPIDGTENFASSLPEWGTAASLFHDGAHAASMIALPELGRRLITGDSVTYAHSRITGFSSGIDETLVRKMARTPQSRVLGAAVYNFYGVITGRLASFINPVGAYSWDLLAGLALAREHDCEVFVDDEPYDGRYLEPGRRYRVEVHHRHDRHPR